MSLIDKMSNIVRNKQLLWVLMGVLVVVLIFLIFQLPPEQRKEIPMMILIIGIFCVLGLGAMILALYITDRWFLKAKRPREEKKGPLTPSD